MQIRSDDIVATGRPDGPCDLQRTSTWVRDLVRVPILTDSHIRIHPGIQLIGLRLPRLHTTPYTKSYSPHSPQRVPLGALAISQKHA